MKIAQNPRGQELYGWPTPEEMERARQRFLGPRRRKSKIPYTAPYPSAKKSPVGKSSVVKKSTKKAPATRSAKKSSTASSPPGLPGGYPYAPGFAEGMKPRSKAPRGTFEEEPRRAPTPTYLRKGKIFTWQMLEQLPFVRAVAKGGRKFVYTPQTLPKGYHWLIDRSGRPAIVYDPDFPPWQVGKGKPYPKAEGFTYEGPKMQKAKFHKFRGLAPKGKKNVPPVTLMPVYTKEQIKEFREARRKQIRAYYKKPEVRAEKMKAFAMQYATPIGAGLALTPLTLALLFKGVKGLRRAPKRPAITTAEKLVRGLGPRPAATAGAGVLGGLLLSKMLGRKKK